MSILDDAIREHLELKRAHGADDAELKKLEDEAFGPPARPGEGDSFSGSPTEFLAAPATNAADAAAEAQAEPGGRRIPNIADLQEAPPPPSPDDEKPDSEDAPAAEVSADEQTIPVPHPETEAKPEDAAPAEEPAAAEKDDAAPADDAASENAAPQIDTGPSTEEREAIAEEPTELFDVEADIGAGTERPSPTDEQLLDSQLAEPRLAPVDPTGPIESTGPDAEVAGEPIADEEEEDDDFFSEQRLSDELNQALEAPITDEHEAAPATDEHEAAPTTDQHEAGPPSEEHTAIYDVSDRGTHEEDDEPEGEEPAPRPTAEPEDVLEDTPDFLEDAPEDDELWFEQKPPKDFDFDD